MPAPSWGLPPAPTVSKSPVAKAGMGTGRPPSKAPEKKLKTRPDQEFIRVIKDKQGMKSLEVAVLTFRGPTGQTVDLVSAVHVGDLQYYRQLNQMFASYDVVLYELIAEPIPNDRPVPMPGGNADNPVSALQHGMKNVLGLSFQLDEVDYLPQNFVHADISPTEFQKSMKQRGESLQNVLMKAIQSSLADEDTFDSKEIEGLDVFGVIFKGPTKRDQAILRRVMANNMKDLNKLNQMLGGDEGSTIVSVRNEKALSVLAQKVKQGKHKLAIFYGVAHMPDMAARLEQKYGYRLQSSKWLKAWDLYLPPEAKKPIKTSPPSGSVKSEK